MLITFLDKGRKFDGSTLNERPLGASEKSLILFAETLANIGHVVRIFNNCEKSIVLNKVSWNPISDFEAIHSDVWISLNDPTLFDFCEQASKKVLWLINSGLKLAKPDCFRAAVNYNPTIVYQGENHIHSIPEGLKALDARMIPLGVSDIYFSNEALIPSVTPKALVTTNPLMDLDWLINLWIKSIHTKLPWAELHIFSLAMYKGLKGEQIGDKYQGILEKIKNNINHNIYVKEPKIDIEFIRNIKDMRVHLYPSHKFEASALTLLESQVMGIPAVIRPLGAAPEKIYNGKTGFVAHNDNDFSEYAIRLLSDMGYFKRISSQSKDMHKNDKWEILAQEFLKIFETGIGT